MIEPPSSQTVPRRTDGIIERELPGELLLHVLGGPVAIAPNASARAVWEICDGHRSLETVARDLAERFDAARGEIPAAFRDVVGELVHLRILVVPAATDSHDAGS